MAARGSRLSRLTAGAACALLCSGAPTTSRGELHALEISTPVRCKANHKDPALYFDYRLHTNYTIEIPRRQLAGPPNKLDVHLTVTPLEPAGAKVFQRHHRVHTPEIEEGGGSVELSGNFAVGPGKYAVEWSFADLRGRGCSVTWQTESKLGRKARDLRLALAPGEVQHSFLFAFRPQERVERTADSPRRVKLLVNFSPVSRRSSTLQPWEYVPLVSIIRQVVQHPEFTEFSLVAFSMEDQKVFYRQPPGPVIDFRALGRAMQQLSPGTVEFSQLGTGRELGFLSALFERELGGDHGADVVIFAGPKRLVGEKVSEEALAALRHDTTPLYYLTFNPFHPRRNPWRDAIGNAVKYLQGEELRIIEPADLQIAVDKIVEQLRSREARIE